MKKLFELDYTELSIVLCKIAEPAANFFGDDDVPKAFLAAMEARKTCKNHMHYMSTCLAIFAPIMLGEKHRDDVAAIVAALKGVPVEKIKAANGIETVLDIIEMFTKDADLMTFFRTYAAYAAPGGESGDLPARPSADDQRAG